MIREATEPRVATAPLVEVFASIQGEGPQVGCPTVFVRTAGCPLRCTYCDTVESYRAADSFEVRGFDGTVRERVDNPVTPERLAQALDTLADGIRWLSLTGGEPTLWPDFGVRLFELVRARGLETQLESAAHDVDLLRPFLPQLDFYSMDWKFPSTLHARGAFQGEHRDAHLACLDAALAQGVRTSVKIVLTPGVEDAEWADAIARLRPFGRRFTLVLQPVTPCLDEPRPLSRARLLAYAEDAVARGLDVRVLPQIHPVLGVE